MTERRTLPSGTTLRTADGQPLRLHVRAKTSLWVIGHPSRKQWQTARRQLGLDKRQARRLARRHTLRANRSHS